MKTYVITYHALSHGEKKPPLNPSFLKQDKGKYAFYLIDSSIPSILEGEEVIQEKLLDPLLHQAGGSYLGEWSFLLAELKHRFATYPFYMISSRFYEKNKWLSEDLNAHQASLAKYLAKYRFGYLPSYDRPFRFLSIPKKEDSSHLLRFFPFTEKSYDFVYDCFHVKWGEEYLLFSDFFCNYIGFQTREDLEKYVSFYLPMIRFFFDASYQPKVPIEDYVRPPRIYPNEKPFTFLLEKLSHLYFFKNKKSFFSLHYDGYYEIDEHQGTAHQLESIHIPAFERIKRAIEWQKVKFLTEGKGVYLRKWLKPYKKKLFP